MSVMYFNCVFYFEIVPHNLFLANIIFILLTNIMGVRVQGRSRPCPLSVGLNSISLKPTLAHHPLSLDE